MCMRAGATFFLTALAHMRCVVTRSHWKQIIHKTKIPAYDLHSGVTYLSQWSRNQEPLLIMILYVLECFRIRRLDIPAAYGTETPHEYENALTGCL